MERSLVIKILGKRDAVNLDDSIHNLREISREFRKVITLNIKLEQDFIHMNTKKLEEIYKNIKMVLDKLMKEDNSINYSNSRRYLIKYLDDLCKNINRIISSLMCHDIKKFTYHSNIVIDLLLVY